MSHTVIAQSWIESESGWGQRPDGETLHLTMEDCKKFREAYWRKELKRTKGRVPHIYSRESGEPYSKRVNDKIYKALKKRKADFGIWEQSVR